MKEIIFIDRITGKKEKEKIYHERVLRYLYDHSWLTPALRFWLKPLLTQKPWFSQFYGYLQKQSFSKRKIQPFIDEFNVEINEFLDPPSSFQSFNEFFIRKLKPEARPIDLDPRTAVIPADGRYYFYSNLKETPGFIVKGKKFNLESLLKSASLAKKYQEGSIVLARLCPSDYHRFHFPFDCLPGQTQLINGFHYSVNPIAIKKNIDIFTENKRTLSILQSPIFGQVLYLEIGATNVGSIQETYSPNQWASKGSEKGYFEFGGSALILLFEKNAIFFDSDLLEATENGLEIRCLMGQSMGKARKV